MHGLKIQSEDKRNLFITCRHVNFKLIIPFSYHEVFNPSEYQEHGEN